MAYTSDKKDVKCAKCPNKVKLVRCSNCNGKGNTQWTTCKMCPGDGYACENQSGDHHHKYR